MSKTLNASFEEYEKERIAKFQPATVKKRQQAINSVLEKMGRYRDLDESKDEDIEKIEGIVFELFPLLSKRTARDYATTAIRFWKLKQQERQVNKVD